METCTAGLDGDPDVPAVPSSAAPWRAETPALSARLRRSWPGSAPRTPWPPQLGSDSPGKRSPGRSPPQKTPCTLFPRSAESVHHRNGIESQGLQ